MTSTIWGPVDLTEGSAVTHTLGALELGLRRTPEEVWIGASHDPVEPASLAEPPPTSREEAIASGEPTSSEEWTRWAVGADDRIELSPSFPDRPIVVAPERPFSLPPEGRARMYVRVPLFVKVDLLRGHDRSTLAELPSMVLSDTWWGDFLQGEIAYWLGTQARRQVTDETYEPHLAVCPFMLINKADQPLAVERFAVNVSYLTLFGRGVAQWADEVQVRYQGGVDGSDIRYTGRVPDIAGAVERIAAARQAAPRGLKARMFGKLRVRLGAL